LVQQPDEQRFRHRVEGEAEMSTRGKVPGLRLSHLTPDELFDFERRMGVAFELDHASRNKLWLISNPAPQKWGDFLRSDRVARCLTDNEQVKKLLASVTRKAKSQGQESVFGRADATYSLLSAVGTALARFNALTQTGTKPMAITKADWDRAIAAAQTLRDLERKGLRVSAALPGGAPTSVQWLVPIHWLDRMSDRLKAGKERAKKAHGDEYSADRAATRDFTVSLLRHFGAAPPGMVQTFADLIGYSREAVRQRLPQWIHEYRTDSLI
jgi:hypothetical protein